MLEKEYEIKRYIESREQTEWESGFVDTIAELTSLKKEVKEWFLSEWLKNDKGLLSYADLAMKTEDLSFWESIKFKLLDIKLSLTCSYFSDFKNFLKELKHWNNNSNTDNSQNTDKKTDTEPQIKRKSTTWNTETTEWKAESVDWKVKSAVQWAISIAEDDSYWYARWGTGKKNGKGWYDCQSFVRAAFIHAWFDVPKSWSCRYMKWDFEKVWFEWIPLPKSKEKRKEWAAKNAKKWDIFLEENKHTELYTWNNLMAGAHWYKDNETWDSTWEEISLRDVKKSLSYRNPDWVLRYKWDVA